MKKLRLPSSDHRFWTLSLALLWIILGGGLEVFFLGLVGIGIYELVMGFSWVTLGLVAFLIFGMIGIGISVAFAIVSFKEEWER